MFWDLRCFKAGAETPNLALLDKDSLSGNTKDVGSLCVLSRKSATTDNVASYRCASASRKLSKKCRHHAASCLWRHNVHNVLTFILLRSMHDEILWDLRKSCLLLRCKTLWCSSGRWFPGGKVVKMEPWLVVFHNYEMYPETFGYPLRKRLKK